ncbi:MAG: tRNA (adenine-N1)-methyltransferase [Eubacteriales bacterium]|nr:tRNA (adenine-N1)-methyltransferase [Bacillota bacterium]MBV1727027.1 tRNA (adenine-N1)-methyltransferase [Desulforudis sp.]MDP3050307.1 tRNA (adenine-N1)-methyltransferase [Eubacteriales bacterium]MDQ7789226.1 tRNA (adenine-N1)-methyltransferase [Clostridia bacterium]MBV1734539.1 tRNA (adenine-N1)-methyltransferase [Desulforudis sp.]
MPFKEGDLVVFLDHQDRSFRKVLKEHGRLQTHRGFIDHRDLFGKESGSAVRTSKDKEFYVFYPTLVDYTMNMPRMSGIVYPKDAAYMLMWGDIFPGARVVTGGVGSGALILALTRQVGTTGCVFGYDVRQDMLDHAAQNVSELFGEVPPQLTLKIGNLYREIEEDSIDTVMLDVPEPWEVVRPAAKVMKPGGVFVAYCPTIRQVDILTQELRSSTSFGLVDTVEILVRSWHVRERSVRPNHRMVGHTGFVTIARRIIRVRPPVEALEPEAEFSEETTTSDTLNE